MEPKTYTLTLTHAQVDTILLGLAELKLKDALGTFQTIHQQCAQGEAPEEAEPEVPDGEPDS